MKHVTHLLQLFVSGELDGPQRAGVEEHLNECAACRAEADRVVRMWEDLGRVGAPPQTGSVWSAVRARTFGEFHSAPEGFAGSGGLARGALAATALAAGLALGVLMPERGNQEQEADPAVTAAAWFSEATWISGASWLGGDFSPGIDELLLGADLQEEGNGS